MQARCRPLRTVSHTAGLPVEVIDGLFLGRTLAALQKDDGSSTGGSNVAACVIDARDCEELICPAVSCTDKMLCRLVDRP